MRCLYGDVSSISFIINTTGSLVHWLWVGLYMLIFNFISYFVIFFNCIFSNATFLSFPLLSLLICFLIPASHEMARQAKPRSFLPLFWRVLINCNLTGTLELAPIKVLTVVRLLGTKTHQPHLINRTARHGMPQLYTMTVWVRSSMQQARYHRGCGCTEIPLALG
ncbi:hypothetical protein V8C40DRAFT_155269 [Trichoderma camerunense]